MIAKADTPESIDFVPESEVLVYCDDDEAMKQPDTFQFCPLGVQLYTFKPIKECQLIDFTLDLPGENGTCDQVACTGLVAQCCAEDGGQERYRVWVKFLDLGPEMAERIRLLTTSKRFTCPFCLNF